MLHVHNALRRRVNPLRTDPTNTGGIRRAFQAEILRRVKAFKKDLWEFLVTLDALGLGAQSMLGETSLERMRRITGVQNRSGEEPARVVTTLARPQPREFQFRTDPDKVQAFRDWVEDQMRNGILKPSSNSRKPWIAKYLESAYKRGKLQAYTRAGKKQKLENVFGKLPEGFFESSFIQPEATRKVALLATRAFEDLKGVTTQMGQQMNRILAQGMLDGKNPRQIARQMFKSIDGLTKKRALVIARTEVINAHAVGTLDAFRELGVGEVNLMAEWSTAGDDRVCPACSSLEGKVFKLKDADGLIPLHPNCRCAWIPSVSVPGKKRPVAQKRFSKAAVLKKNEPEKKLSKSKQKQKVKSKSSGKKRKR